jgi:hypothetical protein
VKRKSISKKSKTDWARLKSERVARPTKDHPEADVRHIVRGIVRLASSQRRQKPPFPFASIKTS